MTVEDAWDTLVAECPANGATMSFGARVEPGGPYVGLVLRFPEDKCDVSAAAGHRTHREMTWEVFEVLAKYGVVRALTT